MNALRRAPCAVRRTFCAPRSSAAVDVALPGTHSAERTAPGVPLLLLLLAAGCLSRGSGDEARAYRITEKSQTVGGPAAIADVGDYILENGAIRVAILKEGNSPGPGMFGGSLVDLDRARHDGTHRSGKGMDAFAELMPMVNLMVPGYRDDPARRSHFDTLTVEVLAEGDREALAELLTALHAGPRLAWVERVTIADEPYLGDLHGFTIETTGW
jgi:hypothetical protein